MKALLSFVLLLRIWLSLYRGGYPGGTLHKFGAQKLAECDNVECITLGNPKIARLEDLHEERSEFFGRASHTMVHENTNSQQEMVEVDTELVASFSPTSCTWAFLFSLSTGTTNAFIDDLCISQIHSMRRYNQFHPISIKDNHFQSPVVPVFCVSTLKRFFSTKIRSPPRNLRKIPQRSECCGNRYLHYNYCSIIYIEHLDCRWKKGLNRDAISEQSNHGYGDTTQTRIDIELVFDIMAYGTAGTTATIPLMMMDG